MRTSPETNAADVEAIGKVVADVEHAQRNELPEAFIGLFRADAVWTTAQGVRLNGIDEIAAFTRKVLPGAMKGMIPTYEVEQVLFIRSDVAAVKVRQRYWDDGGEQVGREGSPLYVMAKEGGAWRLVACQNTQVVEG
ncbi:SgcJ/EcaC family oxidoreductase [Nocardiopsis halophila]|uniref:SgcJ/EcaC family oxidoreductase n=1 Tax=Nocardiopsis halophila TaxID=141692 RepID=UPI00034ADC2C|nr:SgcJ/EcaC family oxidoreductase [Nocardiopsis halophila]